MYGICHSVQGLPTSAQLASRFANVSRAVRQLSYVPEGGAGLATIGVAKLASLLKVNFTPCTCTCIRSSLGFNVMLSTRTDWTTVARLPGRRVCAVSRSLYFGIYKSDVPSTPHSVPALHCRCRSRWRLTSAQRPSTAHLRR